MASNISTRNSTRDSSIKMGRKNSPISALNDTEMDEYAVFRMAFVLLMLTLFIGLYLGVKQWRSKNPRRTRQNHYDLLNFHPDTEGILDESDDDIELFDRLHEPPSGILVADPIPENTL